MTDAWIEVAELKSRLSTFFQANKSELSKFGNTVNQTFEAFVFAQVVAWFRARSEWTVEVINPTDKSGKETFRLKFSTRGRPAGYSYVRCTSKGMILQIRHQLRVATKYHRNDHGPAANICLDVAVIEDVDLSEFDTNDFVQNSKLITFGEAKHMSAFAELIASFIGLVHELQPHRLKRVRNKRWKEQPRPHPSPFLFVSGHLWRTAEGLTRTVIRRKYDVDVYNKAQLLTSSFGLPTATGKPNKAPL
jgi:hypothetical protein